MKKRIAFRKLGRTSSHKWSMLRNMVSSLIEHERIVTTVAKAKELRPLAEQMITLAKNTAGNKTKEQELHHRRRALAIVRGEWNVTKLFEILGPRYQFRQGGYTRILKLSKPRAGDNAPMAVMEYVDRPGEIRAARPPRIFQESILLEEEKKNNPSTITTTTSSSGMTGLEQALRTMGIKPVDELVNEKERKQIQSELAKNKHTTKKKKEKKHMRGSIPPIV